MVFGFFEGLSFDAQKDIPDLSGKVILVTGGNTGLGLATCQAIAAHNPKHLYLSARNPEKASKAISEIKKSNPSIAVTFIKCDLADLSSVQSAAKEFTSKSDRLDVLFCNAGIMAMPLGLSGSGYEAQFGTNHVGHALLIKLLLPTLTRTAEEPASDVRIVLLSSLGHNFAANCGGIDFETLKTTQEKYSTWTRYGQSKLANLLYAKSLHEHYPSIKSVSVHPGLVATNLADTWVSSSVVLQGLMKVANFVPGVAKTSADGAKNQLWAAFAASGKVIGGMYYEPVGIKDKANRIADDELAEELWVWTQEELKGYTV